MKCLPEGSPFTQEQVQLSPQPDPTAHGPPLIGAHRIDDHSYKM